MIGGSKKTPGNNTCSLSSRKESIGAMLYVHPSFIERNNVLGDPERPVSVTFLWCNVAALTAFFFFFAVMGHHSTHKHTSCTLLLDPQLSFPPHLNSHHPKNL
jgi:hypothetical protein